MIVQNIKTGVEYSITKADYDKLVSMKIHRNYTIISKEDVKRTPLIPKEIVEYQQVIDTKKLKIESKKQE